MRGLVTSDFEYLKENVRTFIIVFAIAFICFASTSAGPSFLISYISVLAATMAWNNIGNDDLNNSMAYIFTLPLSRKDYVKEKYLLGTGMILFMWGFAVLVACGVNISGYRTISWEELALSAAAGLSLALFIIIVQFPIQMKYGSNAGKMALFAIVFGAMGIYWIGSEICDRMRIDLSFVKDSFLKVLNLGLPVCLSIIAVLLLLLVLISCTISIKIMEKKEY